MIQVLKIDHDDAISISSEEEITDEEDEDADSAAGFTPLQERDRPISTYKPVSFDRLVSSDRPDSGDKAVSIERPVSSERPRSKGERVSSSPLPGTEQFITCMHSFPKET